MKVWVIGMLARILDLKNTFEGKFLAVLMSVVLVLSMTNVAALAGIGEAGDGSTASGEIDGQAGQEAMPQDGEVAAGDPDATVKDPLVTSAVDEAVVAFEAENAYVSVRGQDVLGKTLNVELHKELKFVVAAHAGYQIESVTARNAASAEVPVITQDGTFAIAADYVDSTLVVTVKAVAVAAEEPPAVETTPITGDTVIETEASEAEEPEAPAEDEEAVEVEADVSSPAFEGYAYAGNVIVKVTAAEGVLPEGTTVQALEVGRQDVVDAVADKVESEGKTLEDAIAIDVTLRDKDGKEIQPSEALNVCFFDANVQGEEIGV